MTMQCSTCILHAG